MVKLKLSSQEQALLKIVREVKPQGIIFDMDGTLYDESHFIEYFAEELSVRMVREIGSDKAAELKFFYLENWRSGLRNNLFDRSIEKFEIHSIGKEQILELMRTLSIPGGLPMKNWVIQALSEWELPMAVLTNGDPKVQRTKFAMLQPNSLLQDLTLVCAKEFEPKPSPAGAQAIISGWGVKPSEVVFFGDNLVDELCAKAAGCHFVSC
jgi:FMN phosphatase YigB (HAD superfamily)